MVATTYAPLLTSLSLTGPLAFTYYLTPQVSMTTTVIGDARNNVNVQIISGSVVVYSASMTQASPVAVIPYQLVLGDAVIEKDSTFTLTIPTALQPGNVVFKGQVASGPNPPQPFAAIIASWPLNSSVN